MENNLELKIFENNEFGKIRTTMIDGEPWFVGKDVCLAFGDTHHKRSLGRIDEMDKRVIEIESAKGTRNAIAVNESGLYSLLFTMEPQKGTKIGGTDVAPETQLRIEKLRRFKHWVTSEVLPEIRKTGGYNAGLPTKEQLMEPGFAERLLESVVELRHKVERNELTISVQIKQIAEMKPKASYYDVVINCKGLVPIKVIAKDYGMSSQKMNKLLHELGVQYKEGGRWHLYQEYADQGYTSSKTYVYHKNDGTDDANTHTYWTQKGRLFIYNLLKEHGIIPLIERETE